MKLPFVLTYSLVSAVGANAKSKDIPVIYRGKTYQIYEKTSTFTWAERCKKVMGVIAAALFTLGLVFLHPKFRFDWRAALYGKALQKLAVRVPEVLKNETKVEQKEDQQVEKSLKVLTPEAKRMTPEKVDLDKLIEEEISSSDEEEAVAEPDMVEPDTEEAYAKNEEGVSLIGPSSNLGINISEISSLQEPSLVETVEILSSKVEKESMDEKQKIMNWVVVGGSGFSDHSSSESVQAFRKKVCRKLEGNHWDDIPLNPLIASAGMLVLHFTGRQENDSRARDTLAKLRESTGKEPLLVVLNDSSRAGSLDTDRLSHFFDIPSKRIVVVASSYHQGIENEEECMERLKSSFQTSA